MRGRIRILLLYGRRRLSVKTDIDLMVEGLFPVNELQTDITRWMTSSLSRELRNKITNSESREIVKAIEMFIEVNGGFKPKEKKEDPTHHNFMDEIKKI